MSSQDISILRIQFDFFSGTNINLSKIILIDIAVFQNRTLLEQTGAAFNSFFVPNTNPVFLATVLAFASFFSSQLT